MVSFTY